ncbi:MAG: hypothetical protein AAGK97_07225 [Bacteroidota bacterium]
MNVFRVRDGDGIEIFENSYIENNGSVFINEIEGDNARGIWNRNEFINNITGQLNIDGIIPGPFETDYALFNVGTFINNGSFTTPHIVNNQATTGIYRGEGTTETNTFFSSGTLAPGNSPGTMNIVGNLVLENQGKLEIEIDGVNGMVDDYDQINVTGSIERGGQIEVIANNYDANAADRFQILNYTENISSDFDNVTLPNDFNNWVLTDLAQGEINLASCDECAFEILNWTGNANNNLITANNWDKQVGPEPCHILKIENVANPVHHFLRIPIQVKGLVVDDATLEIGALSSLFVINNTSTNSSTSIIENAKIINQGVFTIENGSIGLFIENATVFNSGSLIIREAQNAIYASNATINNNAGISIFRTAIAPQIDLLNNTQLNLNNGSMNIFQQ